MTQTKATRLNELQESIREVRCVTKQTYRDGVTVEYVARVTFPDGEVVEL